MTSTNPTSVFYVVESDTGDAGGDAANSVSTDCSEELAATFRDDVATIPAEIIELDKIGFDETLNIDNTLDI